MAVKTAAAAESRSVIIPELRVGVLPLTLIGMTPLIVHAWSSKAKGEMLAKQMKIAKPGKAAKDPWQDFQESLYRLDGGGYGFPAVAFKAAAVTACSSVDGITKVGARQAFHVNGEFINTVSAYEREGQKLRARYELVRLTCGEPEMREDMVRLSGAGSTADLRYRGQFWPWAVTVSVTFNRDTLSEGQIINLFNTAGFGVGIGEWRPEKDGSNGRFAVATSEADLEKVLEQIEAERKEAA